MITLKRIGGMIGGLIGGAIGACLAGGIGALVGFVGGNVPGAAAGAGIAGGLGAIVSVSYGMYRGYLGGFWEGFKGGLVSGPIITVGLIKGVDPDVAIDDALGPIPRLRSQNNAAQQVVQSAIPLQTHTAVSREPHTTAQLQQRMPSSPLTPPVLSLAQAAPAAPMTFSFINSGTLPLHAQATLDEAENTNSNNHCEGDNVHHI